MSEHHSIFDELFEALTGQAPPMSTQEAKQNRELSVCIDTVFQLLRRLSCYPTPTYREGLCENLSPHYSITHPDHQVLTPSSALTKGYWYVSQWDDLTVDSFSVVCYGHLEIPSPAVWDIPDSRVEPAIRAFIEGCTREVPAPRDLGMSSTGHAWVLAGSTRLTIPWVFDKNGRILYQDTALATRKALTDFAHGDGTLVHDMGKIARLAYDLRTKEQAMARAGAE